MLMYNLHISDLSITLYSFDLLCICLCIVFVKKKKIIFPNNEFIGNKTKYVPAMKMGQALTPEALRFKINY